MKRNHVFPWWAGYWLLNPLRKWRLDPGKLLGGYVKPGMNILDAGCAMGFFSIPLAQMAGPKGRVFCVDPQKKMLDALTKRASKRGLSPAITIRPCSYASLCVEDLTGRVDLAVVFGVLHEAANQDAFVCDVALTLKPGGVIFFGEPHVISPSEFDGELALIAKAGFTCVEKLRKGQNKIAVMRKNTWVA